MNERNIPISPYITIDDIINLEGYIIIGENQQRIELPDNKSLNLFNYTISGEASIFPRNYESFILCITPKWQKGFNEGHLQSLILDGELLFQTLKLKIQVSCKTSRWCSNQYSIDLLEVKNGISLEIKIPLSEIKDEITLSGFLIRIKTNGKNENRKANKIYSVVSKCEDVIIQIDEIKEIGGSHLPIDPEELGNLLFDIKGLDDDFELPRIKYSAELKEYFVRDNLNIVNTTFMMSFFYFCDTYLKWLIFTCKYDYNDKNHNALIDLLAKYCDITKTDFKNLIEEEKYSQDQIKGYLSLSSKLLYGIQYESKLNYKNTLKQMIKDEMK